MQPKALILRAAGINRDVDLVRAFELAGAETQLVHLHTLIEQPALIEACDILAFPGGFSYGDDIAAGRILANRIRHQLIGAVRAHVAAGKPVIGICNGFQVLVKTGLLPGFESDGESPQRITLTDNALPRFVNKWVELKVEANTRCVWTRGIETIDCPIAHGEGRLVAPADVLDQLEAGGQVALRYASNPNGSDRDIAGICDPTGLVFGLMPHPEDNIHPTHHTNWTRGADVTSTSGLRLFENAVRYAAERAAQPA